MSHYDNFANLDHIDADESINDEEKIIIYANAMLDCVAKCGCYICKSVEPEILRLKIEAEKNHQICVMFGCLSLFQKMARMTANEARRN